jgi:hypothetical protein
VDRVGACSLTSSLEAPIHSLRLSKKACKTIALLTICLFFSFSYYFERRLSGPRTQGGLRIGRNSRSGYCYSHHPDAAWQRERHSPQAIVVRLNGSSPACCPEGSAGYLRARAARLPVRYALGLEAQSLPHHHTASAPNAAPDPDLSSPVVTLVGSKNPGRCHLSFLDAARHRPKPILL